MWPWLHLLPFHPGLGYPHHGHSPTENHQRRWAVVCFSQRCAHEGSVDGSSRSRLAGGTSPLSTAWCLFSLPVYWQCGKKKPVSKKSLQRSHKILGYCRSQREKAWLCSTLQFPFSLSLRLLCRLPGTELLFFSSPPEHDPPVHLWLISKVSLAYLIPLYRDDCTSNYSALSLNRQVF